MVTQVMDHSTKLPDHNGTMKRKKSDGCNQGGGGVTRVRKLLYILDYHTECFIKNNTTIFAYKSD